MWTHQGDDLEECQREGLVLHVPSIERRLRPPIQTGEVRVFALVHGPVEFGGLPLHSSCFFFTLLLLTCFLTVTLGLGGFTCSCDGVLLSSATCRCMTYCEAAPRLRLPDDASGRGLGRMSVWRERESVSELKPQLAADEIWRRMSSIDGDEDNCAGSWSPRISHRTLVRSTTRFRRCEALAPHAVFIAPPLFKGVPTL
jgi:hypothetical protein